MSRGTEELKGKSGNVKIKINYTNNEKHIVSINGKQVTMYTPFIIVAGTKIDNAKNKNIQITKDLEGREGYTFIKGDLADKEALGKLFQEYSFDIVVNLGAQAGVRYSIDNPDAYMSSNMVGFYKKLKWF
mgnify:CR=1 FL=1